MYSNLNFVSTFNSRETVEVVHTYFSSFTLRSTITGEVEFKLSKLPRLPFIGSNLMIKTVVMEKYLSNTGMAQVWREIIVYEN